MNADGFIANMNYSFPSYFPVGFLFQLEQAFVKQKEAEQAARITERERVEKERLEARKRREVQRITDVSCLSKKDNGCKFFFFFFLENRCKFFI